MEEKIVIFVHELQGEDLLNPTIIAGISKAYIFPIRTTTFDLKYILETLATASWIETDQEHRDRTELFYNLKRKFEKRLTITKNDLISIFKAFSLILRRTDVKMIFVDAHLLNRNTVDAWIGYFRLVPTKFVYHEIGNSFGRSKKVLAMNKSFNTVTVNCDNTFDSLDESVRLLKPIVGV